MTRHSLQGAGVGMEIVGPDRLSVSSSINVTARGLAKVESQNLDASIAGSKLGGCKATSIGALIHRIRPNLGNGVSGVFTAADGVHSDPIQLEDLVKGFIVHTDASGAELPLALGGPLRIIFPAGVAVQAAICGTPKAVNLKGAVKLELHSEYELTELRLSNALCKLAPQIILELEEAHSASLFGFARTFGGILDPAKVVVSGLDARGLSLNVTASSGLVSDDLLVPFPRPLLSVEEVMPLAMEMHRSAFANLDIAFKWQSRYYTEPVTVACRAALRSRRFNAVAALAVAVAAVGCARLAFRRR